jgi:hypothetical protein
LRKLQQVSAAKGIIASSNAFQEGVLKYCKSKKIALLRCFNEVNIKWELPRAISPNDFWGVPDKNEIYSGFTSEHHIHPKSTLIFAYKDFYTHSCNAFLHELARDASGKHICDLLQKSDIKISGFSVRYISSENIEEIVQEILLETGYSEGEVSLDKICDWQLREKNLLVKLNLQPGQYELKQGVLGRIDFNVPQIEVFCHPGDSFYRTHLRSLELSGNLERTLLYCNPHGLFQ